MRAQGKGREYLDDLLKEVRTTEGIVSNFLAYARPSRLDLRPLAMDETIRGVCRTMQPEFDRAGVALEQAVVPGLPVITADAATVQQVLANLLRNALEASRSGGHVRVHAARENGTSSGIFVSVEDDGAGLTADILPRLFTPFVTTKAQGTGLGLSLAKKFVEAHGGTIALVPLPRGVRAEVRLPSGPAGRTGELSMSGTTGRV
jgi:signal transduction histidine kinase